MKACTKLATGVLLALGVSVSAQADTIAGLYVGAQIWDMKASGSFGNPGQLTPLNLEDEISGSLWGKLEHPVPLLPNIMVRYNQMDTKGDTTLSSDFQFQNVTFKQGSSVNSDLKLTHADIVLYYEILDLDTGWLDLGLNFKAGDYKIGMAGTADVNGEDASATATATYKGVIPTVYAAGGVGFPFTGIGLFGDVSAVSYKDTKLYDVQAGVSWNFVDNPAVEAQVQLGYRIFDMKVDDWDGAQAETKFKGVFGGVQFHF